MHYKLSVAVFLLASLMAVSPLCKDERPGECNVNATKQDNDTEVKLFCALNCDFETDLCNYSQGCLDEGMTSWEAVNGSAQAEQVSGGCGQQSFSVLQSPWVNFTATMTCLQFKFTQHLPYDLDVYLMQQENSTVHTLRNRTRNEAERVYTYNITVSQQVAKLRFRLFGGGGHSGNQTRLLLLHYVSVTEGSCHTPVCQADHSDGPCGWDSINWSVGLGGNKTELTVNSTDSPASLTLPLTRPPDLNHTHCLTFRYRAGGVSSHVNLSVEPVGGAGGVVWRVGGVENGTDWMEGVVPVMTSSPYRIIFEAQKLLATDEVSLTSVEVTSSDTSSCTLTPPEAWTGVNVSTTSFSACNPAPQIVTTEPPTTTTTTITIPSPATSQSPTVSITPTTTLTNTTTTNPATTSVVDSTTTSPPTTATTEEPATTTTTNVNQSSETTAEQSDTTGTSEGPTTRRDSTTVTTTSEKPVTVTMETSPSTSQSPITTSHKDGMQTPSTSTPAQVSEGVRGDDKDDDDSKDGVIAGVVVAVIVVAIIIVVAIVFWKRKSLRSSSYWFHGNGTMMTEKTTNDHLRYDSI